MAAGREDLETLLKQNEETGGNTEELLERDFVHKRTQLLADQLRRLTFECFKTCRD